ncbi:MAG: hypothetical protein DMG80_04725 [Acidobacteria bacterium]|nr:MAG: hypothetical protein DMG80_04725 [Acidobacteriota bacterium]
MRDRVSVNQRAITGAETLAGILHGSGEGIPVNSLRGPVVTCRQCSVEVIHFELSVYLHERQSAVDSAVEACPPTDCKRQLSGTVGSQQQRLPFLDVMAGPGDFQRRSQGETSAGCNFGSGCVQTELIQLQFIA